LDGGFRSGGGVGPANPGHGGARPEREPPNHSREPDRPAVHGAARTQHERPRWVPEPLRPVRQRRMTTYCEPDEATAKALRVTAAQPGPAFADIQALRDHLALALEEATVVLGPGVEAAEAFKLAESMRVHRPSLGVVLVRHELDAGMLAEALRA